MRLASTLATLLALAVVSPPASSAFAQGYVGGGIDARPDPLGAPGVRMGLGVGPSTYFGPNVLYGTLDEQENVRATRLGVTGHVAFPLSMDRVYGRAKLGLLNIGATARPDAPVGSNPFLTSPNLLVEGNVLYNVVSYQRSRVVPYLYTGAGALIADPFGRDDVARALGRNRVAYFIPVGAGVDFRLSRNVSLFAEASYRFVLNPVGAISSAARASATPAGCDLDPDKPECKVCEVDPRAPGCPEVDAQDESRFSRRFGRSGVVGGVQFGFGRAPRPVAVIPPAPLPPPVVVTPPPARRVCDLVELNGVYFDYGSATLSPRARTLLDENIGLLRQNPECCLFLEGYIDSAEESRFGPAVASRRAQAVYDYYLANGVSASRMSLRNRGVALPPCDKEDPGVGCARSRRVESIPVDCERFLLMMGGR